MISLDSDEKGTVVRTQRDAACGDAVDVGRVVIDDEDVESVAKGEVRCGVEDDPGVVGSRFGQGAVGQDGVQLLVLLLLGHGHVEVHVAGNGPGQQEQLLLGRRQRALLVLDAPRLVAAIGGQRLAADDAQSGVDPAGQSAGVDFRGQFGRHHGIRSLLF